MYEGPLLRLSDIKERNESTGSYWFSRNTMRFFRSRVSETVYPCNDGGAVFVTSEQQSDAHMRLYTVRYCAPSGEISTISAFQEYTTSQGAHRAAQVFRLRRNGVSAISAPYVCETAVGAVTQHAIRGGVWNYLATNRTACGKTATAVNHLQSGRSLPITCEVCQRALGGIDGYAIEVITHVVSYRAEECPVLKAIRESTEISYDDRRKAEQDHVCESDCTWMDGDRRELCTPDTSTYTPDTWDARLHDGSVLNWAISLIRETRVTYASCTPVGIEAEGHEWLYGSSEDPYQGDSRVTETSVYLQGDWTTKERAQIFLAVLKF